MQRRVAVGFAATALAIAACTVEAPTQDESTSTIPGTEPPATSAPSAVGTPTTTTTTTTSPAVIGAAPGGSFTWLRRDGDATSIPFGNVVATQRGFAVVEAVVGSDVGYLWTSSDGSLWERNDLPVDGGVPLLVHTRSGYWLSSNMDDVRIWHSSDLVAWEEVDTTAMGDAFPMMRPYVDPSGPTLIDLSPWNVRGVAVSNGETTVAPWAGASGETLLAVSDASETSLVPAEAPWGDEFAQIVSSGERFLAYAGGLFDDPGPTIWSSHEGLVWEEIGTAPFTSGPAGGEAHSYQVVERNGTLLVLVGDFCHVDSLWRSPDGVQWERLGDSPDRGRSCGGSLQAAPFGWVLVTDGGTELPEPNVWMSVDGDSWEQLDTTALGIKGGDGSTPHDQLSISVVGDHIFIQSLFGEDRSIWVGRYWNEEWPTADVSIGEGTCHSTIPATSEADRIHLEIHNHTPGRTAVVIGVYADGYGHDDLEAYGRDISDRPDFIEALEIFEVGSGETAAAEFEHEPGRYFVVCMDTTSTAIVLDDLIVLPS